MLDVNGAPVVLPEPLRPGREELRKLGDFVESFFPQAGFDLKAREFASRYPVDWIAAAVEQAAGSGKSVGWSYVWGILKRYQAQGRPDRLSSLAAGRSPAAAPAASIKLSPSLERAKSLQADIRAKAEQVRKSLEAENGPR